MAERGKTGLKHEYGTIFEDFIPKLQSLPKRMQVYSEMSTDPVIGSILFLIEMYSRQVRWDIDHDEEDPESVSNAEFLEECMKGMSHTWQDFIIEALSMLPYGFALHEIVYKQREDGRIGWAKLPIRSQETIAEWIFDKKQNLIAVRQDIFNGHARIPADKFLLFRTSTYKNNPEGKSVLRSAYRSWYYKKKLELIEAIGLERDLAGYPVIYVPDELFDDNEGAKKRRTMAEQIVTNIRRDEQMGAVLSDTWKLELLSASSGRTSDTGQVIERYDVRIAQSVLADVLLMGHTNVGSYALAETKTNTLTQALIAWVDSIQDVLNKDAIPRLFALNGIDGKLPMLKHGPISHIDPLKLANILFRLTGIDAIRPDDKMEPHLRQLLGLPPAEQASVRVSEDPALERQKGGRGDNETRATDLSGQYTQGETR